MVSLFIDINFGFFFDLDYCWIFFEEFIDKNVFDMIGDFYDVLLFD